MTDKPTEFVDKQRRKLWEAKNTGRLTEEQYNKAMIDLNEMVARRDRENDSSDS